MIKITVDNNGKVTEVNSAAFLLIAFEEGAPRYGSVSLMDGDFDAEMIETLKGDFQDIVESKFGRAGSRGTTHARAVDLALEDALNKLKREVTNAGYILQLINEDFFEGLSEEVYKPGPNGLSRERAIRYEFDRYAAFSDIVGNIIYEMRDILNAVIIDE